MAELADAPDSKSGSFGSEGSTPSLGTIEFSLYKGNTVLSIELGGHIKETQSFREKTQKFKRKSRQTIPPS